MLSAKDSKVFKHAPEKERILELDVLRGLAFLAVVFQHSLGVYSRKPDILIPDAFMIGMVLHFVKFAVPAFVFATGLALFYNYYPQINYPSFIKKRTIDILAPYILWTCLYVATVDSIPLAMGLAWLKEFSKTLLSGSAVYHLWFVIMIFQFYLLYPLFLSLFKRIGRLISGKWQFLTTVALMAAMYAFLMWFSFSYITEDFYTGSAVIQLLFVEYRDRNFLYFSFYFIMGGIAGVALAKWREFVNRSVSWNSFIFIALYIWVGYELMTGAADGIVNLNCSTPLKPSMFLYTVSELLLLYAISLNIVKYSPAIFSCLKFAGKFSYGSYLAHAMVLYGVVDIINQYLTPGGYLWKSTLAFIFCTLISLAITYLISLIPHGHLLIGPHTGTGFIKKTRF